ncbi:universal stress protein [Dactylosporangium vinaceum]|uniref:Universal stress protein n=1 Tax=Dactylosporangium vinaceum TaxID=53362 RepID=A0ABV5MCX1_9ACTN|nr:universal stress protein [Dactylosporangium vinaceum]UAC00756.1 universal stress protein [Dactylosporangium vinaceum]
MSTNANPPRIVVGYDGSDPARQAVEWAADEAERTGCQLQIVNTYQVYWPGPYYAAVGEQLEAARQAAEQLVSQMAAHVRERACGLDVIGLSIDAPAAATLLDLGDAGARLLVVGSRGAGGLSNLLMGSVSQQVATHAHVPVAVVRGRSTAADGPVVVGVDGSASSEDALALAFAAAADRHTELIAVRIHATPPQPALPLPDIEAFERAALDSSLEPWQERYPDVKVEALVAPGRAAKALLGVSHTAQLVVVGSRGHGGFAGLLLGSVGQQLMHHAECPVLIAHGRRDE